MVKVPEETLSIVRVVAISDTHGLHERRGSSSWIFGHVEAGFVGCRPSQQVAAAIW